MSSSKPKPMTAKQLRQKREEVFRLTQTEMATRLGITYLTYSRYERDKRTIPLPIAELVRCLESKL